MDNGNVFALAVALLQTFLFSAGDLVDFITAIGGEAQFKRRQYLICYTPFYLAVVTLILVLSFACLFLLLVLGMAAPSLIAHVLAIALSVPYAYILHQKVKLFILQTCERKRLNAGGYNYIGDMIGNVGEDAKTRERLLVEFEKNAPSADANKRNRRFFEKVWTRAIEPEIEALTAESDIACPRIDDARERIWFCYCCLNLHASENYMKKPKGLLDRHKVAACYALAIICAAPLRTGNKNASDEWAILANERLAVTVCCSVLSSFTCGKLKKAAKEYKSKGDDQSSELLIDAAREFRRRGVVFPSHVGHGMSYEESLYRSLRYSRIEKRYSVLDMALLAYDWEKESMCPEAHGKFMDYCRESNGFQALGE